MKRVIIVHGYTGTPEKNWFPWLKKALESDRIVVDVPAMPNTNVPVLSEWLPYLNQVIGEQSDELVLVGHSLGCPTILRYLESIESDMRIKGVVLVAGFAEPLPHLPELDSFTKNTWHDDVIRAHYQKMVLIHSTDDQSVPYPYAERLQNRFNAELVTFEGKGHFNEKSGVVQAPFVRDEVLHILQS